MRNRPDISYLTLLGLSLTVVIAMQKGDSCEESVRFKLSDADGHHICFLSVDAIRDAFLAVSHKKSSFIFGHSTPSCTVLTSDSKVLVDIKDWFIQKAVALGEVRGYDFWTRDNSPDLNCLITPSLSIVDTLANARFSDFQRYQSYASRLSSAFPVRAGPVSII